MLTIALISLLASPGPLYLSPGAEPGAARAAAPTVFVEAGRALPEPVRFFAQARGMTAFFTPEGIALRLAARAPGADDHALFLRLEGASSATSIEPRGALPGRVSLFLGDDPERWASGLATWSALRYRDVLPGVDLDVLVRDGRLAYDVVARPGVDTRALALRCEGADALWLDDGALVASTPIGELRQDAPRSFASTPGGATRALASRFRLLGADRFGFEVGGRGAGDTLRIDPGLTWATYLGGVGGDVPEAIALGPSGSVCVAGTTTSLDFPTTSGVLQSKFGGNPSDAFVAQLCPDGETLEFAAFLGGAGADSARGVALDASGCYVVGTTASLGFPTTSGGFASVGLGGGDTFVAKLAPDASALVYSLRIGGSQLDEARAIALDGGRALVTGLTKSADFPTTAAAFDASYNGGGDAFVLRLDPAGAALELSTFLGGSAADEGRSIAVTALGRSVVGGATQSSGFPVTPAAFDGSLNGATADLLDGFIASLAPDGSALAFATFLGGSGADELRAIALDSKEAIYATGGTASLDFPTTAGALAAANAGLSDAFVTKLVPDGSALVYSTFLGGGFNDEALAIAVDAGGQAVVGGRTRSLDFPVTPCSILTEKPTSQAAFVARLGCDGRLFYASYLGGPCPAAIADPIRAIAIDARCDVFLAGDVPCLFPVTDGAFDTTFNGGESDAAIIKSDLLPFGARPFGLSTPTCSGPICILVDSAPTLGNKGFRFVSVNAPPSRPGFLILAGAALDPPFAFLGVDIFIAIDFGQPCDIPVTSDGGCPPEVGVPIPVKSALVGKSVFAQFFWLDPCGPQNVTSSNAIEVTFKP